MKKKNVLKLAQSAGGGLAGVAKSISHKAKKAGKNFLPEDIVGLIDLDLKDFGKLGKKAQRYIKKHPAQSVLLGVGLGCLLGANFKASPGEGLAGMLGSDEDKEKEKQSA